MREERESETRRWRRTPLVIAALTFLAGGLAPLEKAVLTAWHSDDVAWQVAFRTWRPGRSTLYLPPNTYVLKWPLIVGVDRLLPPTPTVLYLVAFFLNGCGLLLVLWSARQALSWGRSGTPLPVRHEIIAAALTVSTLVSSRMIRYAHGGISTRNVETGLYLALVVVATGWLTGRRPTPSTFGWVGVAILIGVLGLNDPLSIYSVVVPIGLIALAMAIVGRGRGLDGRSVPLALTCVGGVAAWRLGMVVGSWVGIAQAPAATEPLFDQWGARLRSLATVTLGGLGLSSYGSRDTTDHVLAFIVGCGTVALVAYGLFVARRSDVPAPAIAGLAWLATVAVLYLLSASSLSPDTNRYVAVGFSGLVPIAAWSATRFRRGELVALGILVVAVANPIVDAVRADNEPHPASRYELAQSLDATVTTPDGVYAPYLDAQITTYYGDGAFTTVPIVCPGDQPTFFRWIVDSAVFDRARVDVATRSYVVPGPGCGADTFIAVFGTPAQIVDAGPSEIWVYDIDLSGLVAD